MAILLDATVVRIVLLPSALALLGGHTWYLPRWLSWLPRVAADEPATVEQAQLVEASTGR